jgi:hypothetical protein
MDVLARKKTFTNLNVLFHKLVNNVILQDEILNIKDLNI